MQSPISATRSATPPSAPQAATPLPQPRREWRFFFALVLPLGMLNHLWRRPETLFFGAIFGWLLIASIDHFWPGAQSSPPPAVAKGDDRMDAWYAWPLRLYVPLQLALIGSAAWVIPGLSWPHALGVAFAVGWVSGAQGITFAHELGHSRSKFDRFCGWVLMGSVGYAHFMVEHYRGHHPKAATWDDPASARRGENVYAFWLRSVTGSFMSALRLEAARLLQVKKSWAQSPLTWSFALTATVVLGLAAFGQFKLLAGWGLACVVAFTLLELVNYIEHYGLQRQTQGGKREPFAELHAWNANHFLTNLMLANLQRHSDHHTRAWKPYGTLENSPPPAPQLPTGYAGCLLLALVPPLWFAVMHKRLDAMEGGHVQRAVAA